MGDTPKISIADADVSADSMLPDVKMAEKFFLKSYCVLYLDMQSKNDGVVAKIMFGYADCFSISSSGVKIKSVSVGMPADSGNKKRHSKPYM